jgi:hypothetical protein
MTDRLRFSHLRTLGTKSPAHLRYELDHGGDYKTDAMDLGSAVHSLVLGGKKVAAYPGPTRRGKEWEAWQAANGDAIVLSKSDHERAARMAESVLNNRDALTVLGGTREKTIEFDYQGVACRATPDAYSSLIGGELKTTKDSHQDRFSRYAKNMGYHAQVAWYRQALQLAGLQQPGAEWYIVAVESAAPHPVTVLHLSERTLTKGHKLCMYWFEQYRNCLESNSWPAYCQSITEFDIPDDDFELTFGDDITEAA